MQIGQSALIHEKVRLSPIASPLVESGTRSILNGARLRDASKSGSKSLSLSIIFICKALWLFDPDFDPDERA